MPRGKAKTVDTLERLRAAAQAQSGPIDLTERNSSPTLDAPATYPGGPAIFHTGVALLEGVNETLLNEVLATTLLKDMVVRRLSPTALLVDHARLDEIVTFLTKRGYEPRVVRPAEGNR